MKYLLIIVAVLMAACNIPPANFAPDPTPVVAEEKAPEPPKPEVKPAPKPAPRPVVVVSPPPPEVKIKLLSCKEIDTGDAKESLNLKLDCMLDNK